MTISAEYSVRGKQNRALLQHFPAELFSLGSNPHPLLIGEQNSFILFFLLLNQYTNLFFQVVNCLEKLFVNAISDTTDRGKP